jgi:hypothetical protein
MAKTNKKASNASYNFLELFLGVLFLLVGLLVFYARIFGVRGGGYTEGWPAQATGAIFMAFGCYRIFLSLRKILQGPQDSDV